MSFFSPDAGFLFLPAPTPDITEHDSLLARQITDATNFIATSTGVAMADLPALRPAIVSAVRELYDGYRELSPIASTYGWMAPFRSYKAG